MKIFDTKKLFVACRVYNIETGIRQVSPYVDYGEFEYGIFINPKHTLILEVMAAGKPVYLDCKSGDIVSPVEYKNDCESSSYFYPKIPMYPLSYRGKRGKLSSRKYPEVSFMMPFDEFVKDRLGVDLDGSTISLARARKIMRMINRKDGALFQLSCDPGEAQQQIDQRVYHIQSKVKTKKK